VTTTSTDIEDIKWLREETGAGVMEAKRALQDAGGDRAKAQKLLEQRGAASATKRAGRTAAQGLVEPYIHAGGQIGVLVELDCETDFVARTEAFKELAHEIAMQVAATNPRYLSVEDIPVDDAAEMRVRFRDEAIKEGKPEKIAGNIAEGRFKKYAQQVTLLDQPYIRDDSKTIRNLIEAVAAKTKENVVVKRFCRFQVGT
jgi:elongation factor Ts